MPRQRRSRSRLPAGLHRIAQVARRTGVSEHALRIWERRYGTIASHRSESGYRLYTEEDVIRIRAIKDLLDGGYAIGEIAMLPIRELEGLRENVEPRRESAPLPGPVADVARERFLAAIESYDLDEAGRVATSAMVAFAPYDLLTQVTAPLLEEIGERWRNKALSVAQEHAASAILRGQLGELLRAARPRSGGPTVVATTPVGELHEFGALIAAVIVATAGASVVYLGPNTPPAEVASAVEKSKADAVLISVVCLEAPVATSALTEIRKAVPPTVDVWAGGRALASAPDGVSFIRSLDELRDKVQRH
ncbi:MAG: MerR family transcriptional regulator [Polyangiales bacterium]